VNPYPGHTPAASRRHDPNSTSSVWVYNLVHTLNHRGQLVFELGAILAGSNIAAILHDDNTIIDRARQAVRARLGA